MSAPRPWPSCMSGPSSVCSRPPASPRATRCPWVGDIANSPMVVPALPLRRLGYHLTSSTSLKPVDSTSHLGSRRTRLRFTVHRPASAEVSPCCHRPSGGDVACGVHVGVARPRAAGDALENRLALAVFRRYMPAVGASLRCVCRWDEFKSPPGLVLEPGHQQPPPLAADLTVERAFLRDVGARAFPISARRSGHRANLQVLDADGVEAARQIGGGLFHPVTAPICFAGAQPRNGQLRSCPPVRSALRPGQVPLRTAQPLGFTRTKAWNAQQLPARQRDRYGHPAIDTDHAASPGPGT